MQQPDLNREGYAIFVRCCDLSASSSAGQFVATIETLDRILFKQIDEKNENFFPNPYGGAIFCSHVEEALAAARALVSGLGRSGISVAIGIAWGRFQRTNSVHEWNAAALPLNVAARLAFSDAASGRVLVSPHVRNKAGARTEFGPELACKVKEKQYQYHTIESADYKQILSGPLVKATSETYERNIVLWDIVKYATKDPDDQADLSHSLALSATPVLDMFGAKQQDYSPAGDGGYAVFDSGNTALEFSKSLGKYAASKDIVIRTGINQGEVAFTKRGPVGPGVLGADKISAQAPPNGIAILADVWENLDKIARSDWQTIEVAPDIFALELVQSAPRSVPARAHVTMPPMPSNYVERPEALASLRSALLAPADGNIIALIALEGMGGIGKTVLAQALFKDEAVQKAFPDGRVWITVGREPTYQVTTMLREITSVLGGANDETAMPETLYRTTLANKAALIVVDDIWSKGHLDPFLTESVRSRILFTTRDASIARFSGAREHSVDLLNAAQSRELLATRAGLEVAQLPPAADDILHECSGLPLALCTVAGLLRGAAPIEWADTAERLRNADLTAIEEQLPRGQQSFFSAIDVSVNALPPKIQQQYGRLAVLLEDMPALLEVQKTLWNVDDAEARRIARLLVDRSLAQSDVGGGIRLHDLQLDYVRAIYRDRDGLELIHGAVRLSAHIIEKDPHQFASQVVGRLLPYQDVTPVGRFVREITAGAPKPWLRPLHPALHPPGTSLLRTLEGHSGSGAVAVTPDGKRVVSGSGTLRLWDLDTGRELRALQGHSRGVDAVAVTPNGKWAVSASRDNTLTVWDLETGLELRTLEGHSASVSGVAVTPDGKWAVSASFDKTLKVWDLETGRELRALYGHSWYVSGVAVTPDGKRVVSASFDKTLKVWDLETGRILGTLEGHSGHVYRVTVTPDGTRAVSASQDNTLRLWDLETGLELRTMEGHSGYVFGVAVTPDGERAVSASEDNTLKVWDLHNGHELRTLEGHSSVVSGVAVTPDGERAVSASRDNTLKVWNLDTGRELPAQKRHGASVNGVAATWDGKLAVSASGDGTLKVWDLETGDVLHTLEGHSASVSAVTVTPNGEQAVSASADGTLMVWDLETGCALRKLGAHTSSVNDVAVTPDGKLAVSASGCTLRVRDLETGRVVRTLESRKSFVVFNSVALTPDGKVAVSGEFNSLKLWDLDSGRELRELPTLKDDVWNRFSGVAVMPDGKRAVSASWDDTLKVWDLESGRALRTLECHSGGVLGVAITPDGKRAVSASWDNALKMWDLDTGLLITAFHCEASATCCAFVDGQRIVAGDQGGRVYILSLEESESCGAATKAKA